MTIRILFAATLLAACSAAAADNTCLLESRASIPVEQDGCLDHTVRELGMSAKQVPGERKWTIGPQFLHPSVVEGGKVEVRMEKGTETSTVHVLASWPGGPKPKAVQADLEERVTSMADMMVRACGAPPRTAKCTFTAPGMAPAACATKP